MPRCVAPGCRNTDAAHLGMFTFPKDSCLNLKWRTNMRRAVSVKEPWKLWTNSSSSRLCGAHFTDECFVPPSPAFARSIGFVPKSYNLKKDAIPTIFEKPSTPNREKPSAKPRGAFEKRRRKEAIKELLEEHVEASIGVVETVAPEDDSSRDDIGCTATLEVSHEPVEVPAIPVDVLSDITNARPQKKYVQKKIQTPQRWAPKQPVRVRSFAVEAKPTMVDQGTQYDLSDTGEPQPVPATPKPMKPRVDDDQNLDQSFLSDSSMEVDDDEDDPDYEPDYDMEVSDSEESTNRTELQDSGDPETENKYIVFESSLKELFKICVFCGYSCTVYRKFTKGTLVEIESVCNSDNSHRRTWRNQPSHQRLPLGNLLLSAAILFSGSSRVKVINTLKFLKVQIFCLRTFFQIQTCYLIPAVDYVWSKEREEVLDSISGPVSVGGDARCCSPGHTAKYGSYTLMDLSTNKILDMQLIQSNEVANSNAMELEGLKRCLQNLSDDDITVSDITTDRHPQVKKFIREKHPEVRHWFDVWHVAKGLSVKILL